MLSNLRRIISKRPTYFRLPAFAVTILFGIVCMIVAGTLTAAMRPPDPYLEFYKSCEQVYDNFNSTKWYHGIPGEDGYTLEEMKDIARCYKIR